MGSVTNTPARIELALAPTPIMKLERVSRRLGVELYLKRDDLTGLLESGNKIRKLEFLVGDALAQGLSNAAIAKKLVVTQGAVENHIGNIFAKLGLEASRDENRRIRAVLTYLDSTTVRA